MKERLLVSIECPNCGGPLDFAEGSNAIHCGHCRTNLLVTGRKQLLAYTIPPRVDQARAIEVARARDRKRHGGYSAELFYLPYYRFVAHDYLWHAVTPKKQEVGMGGGPVGIAGTWTAEDAWADHDLFRRGSFELYLAKALIAAFKGIVKLIRGDRRGKPTTRATGRTVGSPLPTPSTAEAVPRAKLDAGPRRFLPDELDLTSRPVEKNFTACPIGRQPLFSIGVRASVLRLNLFHPETLNLQAKTAPVTLSPQEAYERGLRTPVAKVAYRSTVGESLSLIYFPYWITRSDGAAGVTFVDAVSGSVTDADVPEELFAPLTKPQEGKPGTVGFRALTCPNCGWDLPVRPHDVVFFCSSCRQFWQLDKRELRGVRAVVAEIPPIRRDEAVTYVPFWIVSGSSGAETRNFFVPAFRYRNLTALHQMATSLTTAQPTYLEGEPRKAEMVGCYYDEGDARKLAQFLHARHGLTARGGGQELALGNAVLTWFPFRGQGAYLFDPFLKLNLFRNLIL